MHAGLERFTKILFAVDYSSGQPDLGQRIDPNAPVANGGSHHWPSRQATVPQLAELGRADARRQQAVRLPAGAGRVS